MTDPYKDGILSLVINTYEPNRELILSMLPTFHTLVLVLSEAYFLLSREGAIPTLEELPEVEKRALWDRSSGMRDRVKYCRAVHTLGSI